MNKLVSKNPVLRFKEGRKIVKALWGFKTRGDGVTVNAAGTPIGIPIIESSYNYEKSYPNDKLILPGLYLDATDGNIYSPNSIDNNGYYIKVISGSSPILNGTYYETKDTSGKIIDRGRYFGGKKHSLPIGPKSKKSSLNNPNQKIINTPNQKTANNGLSTYKINKLNRKISNPGAYHNITVWQNKLKDFYAPGTFKVDGIWGKNTEAAYLKYLSIKNIPHEENLILTPESVTTTPIIQPTPEAKAIISGLDYSDKWKYPEINVSIPENYVPNSLKANRSDIREVIRRATGKGAYDFTGALRKALRLYINGEQYNADDLAAFGNLDIFNAYKPGFYKQGGNMLPSRNIIERFKLRKFK